MRETEYFRKVTILTFLRKQKSSRESTATYPTTHAPNFHHYRATRA